MRIRRSINSKIFSSWAMTIAAVAALVVQPLVTMNIPSAFAASLTPSQTSLTLDQGTGFNKSVTVSTIGHQNIQVSFEFNSTELDAGQSEYFEYGYIDSSSAEQVAGTVPGAGGDHASESGGKQFTLPADYSDQASIELYFKAVSTKGQKDDFVDVTNIVINGDPLVVGNVPVIGDTSLNNNDVIYKNKGTYTISAKVADFDKDIDTVKWSLDGPTSFNSDINPNFKKVSTSADGKTETWSNFYDLSNVTPGNYTLTFTAKDAAGNEAAPKVVENLVVANSPVYRTDGSGNAEEYFDTIQQAINDTDTEDGDKVVVDKGIYNEDVRINKSISLVAPDGATINGQSGDYAVELKGNLDGVVLSGFTINASAGQEALKIEAAAISNDITIEKNTFVSGNGGHAVYAGNVTNSVFDDNVFKVNAGEQPVILVYVEGESSNVDFTDNTFVGELGNHLAFSTSASGSEFSGNDFSDITAVGKDKLIEIKGAVDASSNQKNIYPTNPGIGWAAINNDSNNFKGVYRLQKAIDVAAAGDTVQLVSDITVNNNDIDITESLTLDGMNHTLFANNAKVNGSDNSALGIDNIAGITIKNITLDGSGGTDLHGINAFKASNMLLENATIKNFRYAVMVNGSDVTVDSLHTSGNSWAPFEVAQSSTTNPSKLTVKGNMVHDETQSFDIPGFLAHIWIEDGNNNNISVVDNDGLYDEFSSSASRWYVLRSDTEAPVISNVKVGGEAHSNRMVVKLNNSTKKFVLSAEITDDVDVKKANFFLRAPQGTDTSGHNGEREAASGNLTKQSDGSWTVVIDTRKLKNNYSGNGEYWIDINAWDTSDNRSGTGTLRVVLDNTNPTGDLTLSRGDVVNGERYARPSDKLTFDVKNIKDPVVSGYASGTDRVIWTVFKLDKDANGKTTRQHNYCNGWTTVHLNGDTSIQRSFNVKDLCKDAANTPIDGVYGLAVRVQDVAGNYLRKDNIEFTIDGRGPDVSDFKIDNENPNDLYTNVIDASAVASDANLANVKFFVTQPEERNGLPFCTGNGPRVVEVVGTLNNGRYEASLDTSSLNGLYCVSAMAGDHAKNHSNIIGRQLVTIDNIKPAHTITSHSNGDYETGQFTLEGIASDNLSGIKEVTVQVNKLKNGSFNSVQQHRTEADYDPNTKKWSFSVDTSSYADGTYRFHVNSKDMAGNERFAPNVDIVVDNTDPAVDAGDDQSVKALTASLAGTSDGDTVKWTVVSTPSGAAATFDADDERETDVTVDTYGEYVFRLTASDLADNTASDEVAVMFDEPKDGKIVVEGANTNIPRKALGDKPGSGSGLSGNSRSSAQLLVGDGQFLALAETGAGDGAVDPEVKTDKDDTSDDNHVLAAQDVNGDEEVEASDDGCYKFLGLCWYWWAAIVLVVAVAAYMLLRPGRSSDDELPPRRQP